MTPGDRRPSLLMIVYYFPPLGMGGVQRPLKFAKYLPEFGWDVTVLAPHPGSYYHTDETLLADLPPEVPVERITAPDPARWFPRGEAAIQKRPGLLKPLRNMREWLRWPDDKIGFAMRAVAQARKRRDDRPFDVVWTSSPPPSVHLAGLRLNDNAGWIADFRDPWFPAIDDWGPTRMHAHWGRRLRRRIVRGADRLVAVNDGIAGILDADRPLQPTTVIHNGYDEADFPSSPPAPDPASPLALVCPGSFSPNTDPQPIFALVRAWLQSDSERRARLFHIGASIDLAPTAMATEMGLGDLYIDKGYLPHARSVQLISAADVLLITVNSGDAYAANVPGRLFESLRTLRPLLLLASPDSAAARLVGNIPGCRVVAPDDMTAGCAALDELARHPRGTPARTIDSIRAFDRREQSRRLAALCDLVRAERIEGKRR